ncbi:MAG: DEAD/DEAH box helicase [Candidatus Bathyarchaeia archaeon]
MNVEEHMLNLLAIIVSKCRENWANSGDCSSSRNIVEDAVFEEMKQKYAIDDGVTWSNFRDKIQNDKIKQDLQQIHENFEKDLQKLSEMEFIKINDDKITCLISFDRLIEDILLYDAMQKKEALDQIRDFFKGSPSQLLDFLEYSGLITINGDKIESRLANIKDIISDDVLTFIEEGDALQIRYGLYESSMSGSDLFAGLRLDNDPFRFKIEYGLRILMKERFLLPLTMGSDIRDWEFRSRIAETVRLLYKLRQRFEEHYSYRNSPRLTRSVKLEIRGRKFPRRTTFLSRSLEDIKNWIQSSGSWTSYAKSWVDLSSIFLKSLEQTGFDMISDFQDRCFKKIFAHLADPQSSLEGIVISAGTGMGKTLSYMNPLLLYVLFEKTEKRIKGTKAICTYPRIKLAENQIEGFIKCIYQLNKHIDPDKPRITIGIEYTGTPYHRSSFGNEPKNGTLFESISRLWEFNEDKNAYVCPYARCPQCNGPLYIERSSDFSQKVPLKCLNPKCNSTVDFVEYCKDDIASQPPDILIITTESLARRLYTPSFQRLFGVGEFCTPRLVMIDEIHLHTSLKGSQVAYLIRRLLQRIRLGLQESLHPYGEPIVLGLSATIGQPIEFFSDLTGIPEHKIEVEAPTDDELEKSGVEYFVFVKPEIGENIAMLSTLIQTCMCVLHNMPQSQDFPRTNYKSLGFVDSLDLVRRWQRTLDDAEREQKLYTLRDPERIKSEAKVRNYFGYANPKCSDCATTVNRNCVHFKEGECWWFMRFGNSQTNPLRVKYKTGGDGHVPREYDLVVTTSAMEVGYDDPDIMCIIQYQSPMNVASFTQRKGRAGRGIRNRPISVAVLSPYRTKDVYYYRNHHILIEPTFERLPLNIDNKSIRKIHGFYSILDLLAFKRITSKSVNTEITDGISAQELYEVIRHPRYAENYLKRLFNYPDPTDFEKELKEILALLKEFAERLESVEVGKEVEPNKILDDYLPANLFSSINLPTVDIYEYNVYDDNEEWRKSWKNGCSQYPNRPEGFVEILESWERGRPCPQKYSTCAQHRSCRPKDLEADLDVNLALLEASIANVTFRWGRTAFWIPPYDANQETTTSLRQMDISNNWIARSKYKGKNSFEVRGKLVPKTLRDLVPRISNGTQENLFVIRPDIIREVKFLTPDTEVSHWIYCFDHDKIYAGAQSVDFIRDHKSKAERHHYDTITERTTSYPFLFYDVDLRTDLLTQGRFKKNDFTSDFETGRYLGIYSDLFHEIYFANKDTGEYLGVRKSVIGSTCTISTRRSRIERCYGFVQDNQNIALGYGMNTDGIDIWIRPGMFRPEDIEHDYPEIFGALKTNFFKFEVLNENKKPGGRNSFVVNAFLNTYVVCVTRNKIRSEDWISYCDGGCADITLQKKFQKTLDSFFTINSRTKNEVIKLLKDADFLRTVALKHKAILEEHDKKLIHRYLEDTFNHSLKHALKSAFLILGGFESERDIGGWTYLNFDYPNFPKHIYIFEHGMYGTGAFRSIYQRFTKNPQKLWNLIEEYLTGCPTSDEEDFLKEILKLNSSDLAKLSEMINKIVSSTKFLDRRKNIRELLDFFRKRYSMELRDEDVRALARVFARPLELENTKIENFILYKELNVDFYGNAKNSYQRELTLEEIQEACFSVLVKKNDQAIMPTWSTFFDLLKNRVTSEADLFKQDIRNTLEKTKGMRKFLSEISLKELEKIHELAEEEQIAEVAQKLGSDFTESDVKKIVRIIFDELDDVPMFVYYHATNSHSEFPEDKLHNSLAKGLLREELEKRLLNTCVDACPSCLQTQCEIDFDLRSKLLLSRRLLKKTVNKLKDRYTVDADSCDYSYLREKILQGLAEKFEFYIKYSLSKSTDIAKLVSELVRQEIYKDGKKYSIFVNKSGYKEISLKEANVIYEIGFRLMEKST